MKILSVKSGILDALPVAAGYVPIAISFGVMGVQAGIDPKDCILMSVFVFAGASQFVAIGLVSSGANAIQIIMSTFFLNLRHLIMSVSLKNKIGTPLGKMASLGALGITDETFSLASQKKNVPDILIYFLSVSLVSYAAWISGTVIGVLFSTHIPPDIADNFIIVLYALFIGLLIPGVKGSLPSLIACAISALVSFTTQPIIGSGWSIIAATITASILMGIVMEKRNEH